MDERHSMTHCCSILGLTGELSKSSAALSWRSLQNLKFGRCSTLAWWERVNGKCNTLTNLIPFDSIQVRSFQEMFLTTTSEGKPCVENCTYISQCKIQHPGQRQQLLFRLLAFFSKRDLFDIFRKLFPDIVKQ